MDQRKPHGYFATRPGSRRKAVTFLLSPAHKCLLGTFMIVDTAKQCDVVLGKTNGEEKAAQVLLGGDRLGEHHSLAAAMSVSPQIENHLDRFLE